MQPFVVLLSFLSSPAALLSRRAALMAAPIAAAQMRPAAAASPVREGMALFSANKVEESISIFDSMIAAQPSSKPYLWQRGLSLYYADRFRDGAEQFKTDVAVNPNDTEEAIWYFLCVARQEGFEAARKRLLSVGYDRRPVMRAALQLFQGETDEAPLQAFATSASAFSSNDAFYGNLYLGLFREAAGDVEGPLVASVVEHSLPSRVQAWSHSWRIALTVANCALRCIRQARRNSCRPRWQQDTLRARATTWPT